MTTPKCLENCSSTRAGATSPCVQAAQYCSCPACGLASLMSTRAKPWALCSTCAPVVANSRRGGLESLIH
eukprot:390372-Lingulodinium_polyedra.AAC.1